MSGSSRSQYLVVGGGIGGLISAIALSQAGCEVRVLEKSDTFGEIGAGIQIAPNAARALDKLGVLDVVVPDAFFPRSLVMASAVTGEVLNSIPIDERFIRSYGYRYFVTHRADLHRALLDACAGDPNIELTAGSEVVEVSQDERRVTARTINGDEISADALVACDGLWSTVRATVFGQDDPPVQSGYVAYRGTVPMPEPGDIEANRFVEDMVIWAGPHLHLVQYPVRRGELRNQVAVFDTRRYSAGADDLGTQLRTAFAGMCPAVTKSVPVMDGSRRWNLVDRDPINTWTAGRIALLGDAAHPMLQYLAQGACQAIEDALVLSECLLAQPGDIPAAFAAYGATRISRTGRVQTNARQFGEFLHMDSIGARTRDYLLQQRPDTGSDFVDWLYAPGTERANGYRPLTMATMPTTPARTQA